ncbi:helix-turn-helix domain-containing protein [Rheinheimera texasensis]|uniref:helix-turn-helix domain-containing protein n=1 Tax=Rheinheimera texasensis TaxID=306205 RepID=UPI00068ACDFD|nr:helix-turn-helix transcriptional regulator [Rheinheimera texasensis]
MTENPLGYFFTCSSMAVIAFSINLLLLRARQQQMYLALAGCLLAVAVLICQPVLAALAPELRVPALMLALPALYLLPPLFWCYVKGITSSTGWRFSRCEWPHFALAGLCLGIVLLTLLLPGDVRYALLAEGREDILLQVAASLRYLVYGLAIITFLLVTGWVLQAGFYLHRVMRRLQQYRAQLRQLFASTEEEEARWINGLLLAVAAGGGLFATALLYDNLVAPLPSGLLLKDVLVLLLVWYLALWGLRQKPGFAMLAQSERVDLPGQGPASPEDLQEVLQAVFEGKYQRSALGAEQATSIANKLQQAMEQDELYLDAALSLPRLARHIGCSANYISQTLNERLGLNFFDYVNRYRVQAAARQLRDTDLTVLDIAMNVGFNAKSSFYTAFKKELQQTPSQYRAAAGTART